MNVQVPYPEAAAVRRAARDTFDVVAEMLDTFPKLAIGESANLRDSLERLEEALRIMLDTDEASV